MLLPEMSVRLAMNDEKQIACCTVDDIDSHHGEVIVDGKVWPLDNLEIIVDLENQWFAEPAVPEAVADWSDLTTASGFSPVVGWHYNGRAFLLMPADMTSAETPE
jgi:hypothetical protein